jgi:tellurite resistance protein TerC
MELPIPFLVTDFMGKPAWVWLAFVGIVVALSVHGEVLQRT